MVINFIATCIAIEEENLCMYAVADVLRMYVFVHKLFVFLGTTEIFVCIWYGIFC